MEPGARLALEIAQEQQRKMQYILDLRKARVLQERPLDKGRKLLLVEKT